MDIAIRHRQSKPRQERKKTCLPGAGNKAREQINWKHKCYQCRASSCSAACVRPTFKKSRETACLLALLCPRAARRLPWQESKTTGPWRTQMELLRGAGQPILCRLPFCAQVALIFGAGRGRGYLRRRCRCCDHIQIQCVTDHPPIHLKTKDSGPICRCCLEMRQARPGQRGACGLS